MVLLLNYILRTVLAFELVMLIADGVYAYICIITGKKTKDRTKMKKNHIITIGIVFVLVLFREILLIRFENYPIMNCL
jgi:uncharacterized membrane protein YeiH